MGSGSCKNKKPQAEARSKQCWNSSAIIGIAHEEINENSHHLRDDFCKQSKRCGCCRYRWFTEKSLILGSAGEYPLFIRGDGFIKGIIFVVKIFHFFWPINVMIDNVATH